MGFFTKLAFDIGKELGKKVKRDLKLMEIKIPHSEKISDLAGDNGLSPSYIKDLIYNSKKEKDLLKIKEYLLNDEKVDNIDPKTLKSLRRYITNKINLIRKED